ncbi:MAG TPA: PQQ-dependent sugar dehydrogenase [Herpetosiphonaceae bacterium]|nr:PQQ-dependent sugar dehydrogenase [Herpetosiphonaceae bacterium]
MRRLSWIFALVGLVGCGETRQTIGPVVTSAPAATVPATGAAAPAGGGLELEPVAEGFSQPTFVAHAGDGSGRVFVVEQGGTIRTLDGAMFLDIRERVNSDGNEQGLLGLAFAPDFADSGVFYLNYTAQNDNSVTARFRSADGGGSGDPDSEEVLLDIEDPAANHNGGMLAFGPDGYLYVGLGDGGAANDRFQNGQNRRTLWGKLLRIDVSAPTGYAIPADNPFGAGEAQPEIWAYGLRNPWRFSFDRATGDLYVGDVGQNRLERVSYQPAGAAGGLNYGWPIIEASQCLGGNSCDTAGLVLPVAEYSHDDGCSITGGYVYRGQRYPDLAGAYLYGDYCSGRIWTLRRDGERWAASEALDTSIFISSFGEDEAGEIYVASHAEGAIYRLALR